MELTAKQKKHLRGLGQKLAAITAVGKAGLTDGVIQTLNTLLDQHELVKVHVPAGPDRFAVADLLAEQTHATCVGLVGRMALLFRRNEALPPDKQIKLS